MAISTRSLFSSSVVVFSCLLCLTSCSEATGRELLVGGTTDSWKIPSPGSDSLNKWAQRSRFIIGDSLVWNYDGTKDSVLLVNRRDYVTCNTSSPMAAYKDGSTIVKLDKSGPHYFISGAEGHCVKGQKMIVVVLSEKHSRLFLGAPSLAPSPLEEFQAPALAPTSRASSSLTGSLLMVALGSGIFLLGLF